MMPTEPGGAVHVLEEVRSLDDLRDADGKYLAGTVNVAGNVHLSGLELKRLPVQFGIVGGHFYVNGNRLTSLEGSPSAAEGDFLCANNRLTSLVGVHRILKRVGGSLYINGNPIESGGIGLLLVEGLKAIKSKSDHPALMIIERHLGQGRPGVLRCQEALHEAGYGEFARL